MITAPLITVKKAEVIFTVYPLGIQHYANPFIVVTFFGLSIRLCGIHLGDQFSDEIIEVQRDKVSHPESNVRFIQCQSP